MPALLQHVPTVWGAHTPFDDSSKQDQLSPEDVYNISEDEDRETTPTSQPHRYNTLLPSGNRVIHGEQCDCVFCELRKSSNGVFTAKMAKVTSKKQVNTKTKSSTFCKEYALKAGMPTPVVTIRLKTTIHGTNKLSDMRCIPDTGASIDVLSSKTAHKMG